MIIKLTNYEVEIKESLTWGDMQDIEGALISGVKVGAGGIENFNPNIIREQKYKALEVCIVKITEGDKEINFSKEWMDKLPLEDGNKLEDKINEITKKK